VADRVKPVSDAEIVELLAAHDRVVTW